uniref:Nuclear receptor subfamily 1, group D, member 4b n=1 Tax=Lepisosteus oculatus TaxID=7918 RepID=W5MGK5_LEPOC
MRYWKRERERSERAIKALYTCIQSEGYSRPHIAFTVSARLGCPCPARRCAPGVPCRRPALPPGDPRLHGQQYSQAERESRAKLPTRRNMDNSPAVRFGRIPKREKQRLLDEMQSYMNSLNESASMEIDCSPPEAPPSPGESQSEEAIGAISRAYRDIFVSGQDRLGRRGTTQSSSSSNNNNHSPVFQNSPRPESSHPHAHHQGYPSYPTSFQTAAHRCPMAPRDPNPALPFVDNSRYGYQPSTSSNQSQCPSGVGPPPPTYPTNYNGYPLAETVGQSSCPWRIGGGAKVLACPLNACPVAPAGLSSQQVWESFSQCFTPAVREVVEFAKSIPGFQSLSQQDQVMLLKAGTFQVHSTSLPQRL